MRAVRCERQGPPEELKLVELPDPVPGPGEVVVRLHTAGLNHRDVWIRQGLYARIQLPCVLGSDGAGVVETAGPLAGKRVVLIPCYGWGPNPAAQGKDFQILGMPRQGTMAEKIAVPASMAVELPDDIGFEDAAAMPVAGLSAYRALVTRGGLRAGEHVLVTGIGGGVASLAMLFARALGSDVFNRPCGQPASRRRSPSQARSMAETPAWDRRWPRYRSSRWDSSSWVQPRSSRAARTL